MLVHSRQWDRYLAAAARRSQIFMLVAAAPLHGVGPGPSLSTDSMVFSAMFSLIKFSEENLRWTNDLLIKF
eukprot:SAG11_NODE_26647_length_342_cov_1.440329_1_plen_71_part_00